MNKYKINFKRTGSENIKFNEKFIKLKKKIAKLPY